MSNMILSKVILSKTVKDMVMMGILVMENMIMGIVAMNEAVMMRLSWHIPFPQSEKECVDEVRKTKYICFNEEYEMTHDPCLVYSFGKDIDSQFERDMNMFSCEVHAFDDERVTEAEHVQRTEFWREHAWNIGEVPYDKPEKEGLLQRRRSLDYIAGALSHTGRQVKFLKSDLEGREWILLRQVITNLHLLDIRQVSPRSSPAKH